jgi:hypothetical protein
VNVTDFARQVLWMEARIAYLEEELAHYKDMDAKHIAAQNDSLARSRKLTGEVLVALLHKGMP